MHTGHRRGIDQIGGKDDLIRTVLRLIACRQRTFDLAQRYRIHLDALLTHQTQNMNVGARLLGETHHVKLSQLGNTAADNLGVVGPDRAAKFSHQAVQVGGSERGIGVI